MSIVELVKALKDDRIKIFESGNRFYAVVVESNGDEFDLTQVDELHSELKSMGYIEDK